jgi:hypothetical protein
MDELQQQQDKLQRQMELTKQEFIRSAEHTSTLGREFLLKKILLPAGAFGLGYFAVKKIMHRHDAASNGHSPDDGHLIEKEVVRPKGSQHWFPKFMLVALPLVQQFFLKKDTDEKVEETAQASGDPGARQHHQAGPPSALGIVAKIVPMAIPVLQQYFAKQAQSDRGYVVEKKLSEDGEYYEDVQVKSNSPSPFNWLYQLMPVVLPLLQQHFLTEKVEAKQEEGATALASQAGRYETVSSY